MYSVRNNIKVDFCFQFLRVEPLFDADLDWRPGYDYFLPLGLVHEITTY